MPLRRMKSSMYRWNKNDIPPNVTNLREYVEIASSDEWSHKRQYLEYSLSFTLVQENDVVTSAIIVDSNFFNTLTQNHVFLIDISSQTIPAGIGCIQLMSLLCLKNNHTIPCAWILMNSTTRDAYTQSFQKLKTQFPELQIHKAITSNDENLKGAIQQIFPESEVSLSLHHFILQLFRKMKTFQLVEYFRNDDNEIKRTLFFILALPLLPDRLIPEAFNRIRNDANLNVDHNLERFLTYFERNWLQEPNNFTVFQKNVRITDNFQMYASRLKSKVGEEIEIWKFTKLMVALQSRIYTDHERIVGGELEKGVQSSKIYSKTKLKELKTYWADLADEKITILEFLQLISYNVIEKRIEFFKFYCRREEIEYFREEEEEGEGEEGGGEVEEIIEIENAFEEQINIVQVPPENVNNAEPENINQGAENLRIGSPICCVCKVNQSTHTFVPCGHVCICDDCKTDYEENNIENRSLQVCPLCRIEYMMIMRIY
ncbi:uncharacterized protein LOC127285187 [Leptopilina boulardi]|uniref:uncharacterized protein LOC127285187 n=1 Tax=Leptopilina boulardi TaxID=63433 RepID=UPI0021F665A9|nr:uncharacterized protein LOC127285187 [Leptopilina boulardi]